MIAWLKHVNLTYTPKNKLKIVFVFYQIATAVPRVYDVSLPPDVESSLETISIGISFGLTGIATTPLECAGLAGYMPRLAFWMALPVLVTLVIAGCVLLSSIRGAGPSEQQSASPNGSHFKSGLLRSGSRRKIPRTMSSSSPSRRGIHGAVFHLQNATVPEQPPNACEKVLKPVLVVVFVLYPKVTNVAFEGVPCCKITPAAQTRAPALLLGLL
jgi:hypothetical protein